MACGLHDLYRGLPRWEEIEFDPGEALYRLDAGLESRSIKPAETVTRCDIQGSGTIRHIRITLPGTSDNLRGGVIRAWWDGQQHPSIEAPVGDFTTPSATSIRRDPDECTCCSAARIRPRLSRISKSFRGALAWGATLAQCLVYGVWSRTGGAKEKTTWASRGACRITIQQIGYRKGLYERKDDWSTATFLYEACRSNYRNDRQAVIERLRFSSRSPLTL